MNFTEIVHRAEKLTIDNSPVILTAVGVMGTVTTAYLTGKAVLKADQIVRDREFVAKQSEKVQPPTGLEIARMTWLCYLPPIGAGTLTIAAIIGANQISTRRAAALAVAYKLSESKFDEYRDKITEHLGVKKEQGVRDEMAQDRRNRYPERDGQIIVAGDGDVLCRDEFSGRYFKSSMENIKKAQNDTNYQIQSRDYASLSDFYERIGLPATSFSEEVGWRNGKLLELLFSTTTSPDGKPCLTMDFDVSPVRDYSSGLNSLRCL